MSGASLIKGKSRKLAFIGAGRMAEAIISGLINGGTLSAADLIAVDISEERLADLQKKYGIAVTVDGSLAASTAEFVLLAVKPQHIKEAVAGIKGALRPDHVIISIAAGVSVNRLLEMLEFELPIVRVMPNTPALVNAGVSAVALPASLELAQGDFIERVLSAIGEVVYVEESQLNAVTAVSGSGPAYFFLFVRELTRAGTAIGLDTDLSIKLARETFFGAARLLAEGAADEDSLIAAVASPGGTTEAALTAFDEQDMSGVIARAVRAAATRAEELDS